MRIGVIRGDLQGPIYLQDLEVVPQANSTTEPRGQERYLSRPTTAKIEGVLADPTVGAGATIEGSDIVGSFTITITGSNNTLRVKTSSAASFTAVTIAQTTYATLPLLVAAVNVALAGTGITARAGTGTGSRLALESNTRGVNSYVAIDSVGNGSNFNTPAGFGSSAVTRTMTTAAAIILASNPVDGTLDVSTATINGVGATTATNSLGLIPSARGTTAAIAEAIAPKFIETPVVIQSFLAGSIAEYRNAAFNTDVRRGLSAKAAIAVVQDDGSSAMTATLPTITSAATNTPTSGAVTIGGTGLGSYERKETVVKFIGAINKTLDQVVIEKAGGSVSATAIIVPASLIPGATATTTKVVVKVYQRATAAAGYALT